MNMSSVFLRFFIKVFTFFSTLFFLVFYIVLWYRYQPNVWVVKADNFLFLKFWSEGVHRVIVDGKEIISKNNQISFFNIRNRCVNIKYINYRYRLCLYGNTFRNLYLVWKII